MKWWYENEEEEMKLYKNEDLCIECKNEFFSKPYDHRDPTPGQLGYCIKCDNFLIKERKMEFDKSRCYTSLNADELKAGDKVIVADSLGFLKQQVEKGAYIEPLREVLDENYLQRFKTPSGARWGLAYLMERAENCTNCGERFICPLQVREHPELEKCKNYKAEPKTDTKVHLCQNCVYAYPECPAKVGDCEFGNGVGNDNIYKCKVFKPKTGKKEMCLNCKHYNKVNDFRDCTLVNNPTGACPHYEAEKHYRPFRDTDELIKVWDAKCPNKRPAMTMPLIWVRNKENKRVWLITEFDNRLLDYLFTNCEFLDGSVCGVEE